MAKITGRLVPLGLGKQTTRGTPVSTPTAWIPRTTFSFADMPENVENEANINTLDTAFDKQNVLFKADGSVEGNTNLTDIGHFLTAFFGNPTTTGASPNYTHTFKMIQTSLSQQYTIFVKDGAGERSFGNGVITALNLEWGLGQ